jgi:multidrug resistance efflux pump
MSPQAQDLLSRFRSGPGGGVGPGRERKRTFRGSVRDAPCGGTWCPGRSSMGGETARGSPRQPFLRGAAVVIYFLPRRDEPEPDLVSIRQRATAPALRFTFIVASDSLPRRRSARVAGFKELAVRPRVNRSYPFNSGPTRNRLLVLLWSLVAGGCLLAALRGHGTDGLTLLAALPISFPDPARPQTPRPVGTARSRRRRRLWRIATWVLGTGLLVGVGFIPYPYHTGGPFRLLPAQRLDVRSELEGLVEEVRVSEGDWVEKGQPIASLVKRTHERNVKATQAQLDEKEATLRLLKAGPKPEAVETAQREVDTARANLAWSGPRADRFKDLRGQKLVSDQEYENALRQRDVDAKKLDEALANLELVKSGARKEEIEAAQAEVDSLRAMLDNYRTDVERTLLVSPIAGRIVTPRVQDLVGTYVKPGQRDLVVQVEDSRVLQAEVEVPEEDAAGITIGAPVEIAPWAYYNRTFVGRVASIAPIATTNTTSQYDTTFSGQTVTTGRVAVASEGWKVVRVITEIPNPDGLLKSELTGYAKIATGSRPVWDVLLRPFIRWIKVEVWYWIP